MMTLPSFSNSSNFLFGLGENSKKVKAFKGDPYSARRVIISSAKGIRFGWSKRDSLSIRKCRNLGQRTANVFPSPLVGFSPEFTSASIGRKTSNESTPCQGVIMKVSSNGKDLRIGIRFLPSGQSFICRSFNPDRFTFTVICVSQITLQFGSEKSKAPSVSTCIGLDCALTDPLSADCISRACGRYDQPKMKDHHIS